MPPPNVRIQGGIKSKVELNLPTEVFEYISLTMPEVDIWDGSYDSASVHRFQGHLRIIPAVLSL